MDEATARETLGALADARSGEALGVAVRLGLFTALTGRRETAGELAPELGADASALEVLADALVAVELLTKQERRYANAPLSDSYLVRGGASYLGGELRAGRPTAAVRRLLRAVRHGPPSTPAAALPRSLIRALDRDAHVLGPHLARAVDLSGSHRLLDVGGGLGGYAAAFCDAYPGLRATVFDLPDVARAGMRLDAKIRRGSGGHVRSADPQESDQGADSRVDFIEGDFRRDRLPSGCDAVLASDVLHGRRAPDAARLVRSLFDALEPGGTLVLRDVLMDADRTSPRWGALFSLTLLVASASRCHTEDEVRAWLADAGFVHVREVEVETESWDPNRVLLATRP